MSIYPINTMIEHYDLFIKDLRSQLRAGQSIKETVYYDAILEKAKELQGSGNLDFRIPAPYIAKKQDCCFRFVVRLLDTELEVGYLGIVD